MQQALQAHLKTGSTTVCRTWAVRRKDGVTLGFTDHDCDLTFDGVQFLASTGLSAGVVEKTSGLAVDNTEVLGALSDASVSEVDIIAGRYDGAEVIQYLVNWSNIDERSILFKGTFGEIVRSNGTFRVELRGLTEPLNMSRGRVYHSACSASLGDRQCKVDVEAPSFSTTQSIVKVIDGRILQLPLLEGFSEGCFVEGRLEIKTGMGKSQTGLIKSDVTKQHVREIELWHAFGQPPEAGDQIGLVVGCDKRGSTCRSKFDNFLNFRGFPHIPGEDWLRASPGIGVRG